MRRAAPPTRGIKRTTSTTTTGDMYTVVRRLLIEYEGGKFDIKIDGKRISRVLQAVPGYSRDVAFIVNDKLQYMMRDDVAENFTVEVLHSSKTSKTIRVSSKQRAFTVEKFSNSYAEIFPTHSEKKKELLFMLDKIENGRPIVSNLQLK